MLLYCTLNTSLIIGSTAAAKHLPFTVKNVWDVGFRNEVIFTAVPVVFMLAYEACVVTRVCCSTVVHHRVQWVSTQHKPLDSHTSSFVHQYILFQYQTPLTETQKVYSFFSAAQFCNIKSAKNAGRNALKFPISMEYFCLVLPMFSRIWFGIEWPSTKHQNRCPLPNTVITD